MAGGDITDFRAIEALLRFYGEAGVDGSLAETPVDRFAQSQAAEQNAARPAEAERRLLAEAERAAAAARRDPPTARRESLSPERRSAPAFAVPSEAAIMAAREAAAGAETLEDLRATLESFAGCNLRFTATNLVFADGEPSARVMFVGEAPGFEEDLQGLPFVGRSGQLLDRMMAAIGLDRSTSYIANVIPWRPPGNRTPTPQETEICRPFIERQITLADPDILVLVGGASAKQLLRTSDGITKLRGRWHPYDTGRRIVRAMPILHPAGLLRNPLQKRLAWRDLLAVKGALEELDQTPGPAEDHADSTAL